MTHERNGAASILLTCILLAATTCGAAPRFCSDEAARLAAHAYVLSWPLLGQDKVLEQLIKDNRQQFLRDGAAVRCMKSTGTALVRSAITAYEQNKRAPSAVERFGGSMPPGLEHLPAQVDSSIRNAGTEFFTVGQELLWLSEVLPAALDGNAARYNAHDTMWRQQVIQLIPMINLLCSMDASVCETFKQSLQATVPIAEQQVFIIATGRY